MRPVIARLLALRAMERNIPRAALPLPPPPPRWRRMTHTDGTISITVNGEHRRVAGGLTLAGLANELGLAPEKVAVERNMVVVPRSTLGEVALEDGDEPGDRPLCRRRRP